MRYLVVAVVAAAALAFSIVAVPAAQAGAPNSGGGSFTLVSSVVTNVRTVGPNTILQTTDMYALTGSFSGTEVCNTMTGIRSTGETIFGLKCAFTGTVEGNAGTARVLAFGTGAADGSFHGRTAFGGGTGDLAGLTGNGTFEGAGTSGTYSVQIHFAP